MHTFPVRWVPRMVALGNGPARALRAGRRPGPAQSHHTYPEALDIRRRRDSHGVVRRRVLRSTGPYDAARLVGPGWHPDGLWAPAAGVLPGGVRR